MNNEEILKLADECGFNCDTTEKFWLVRNDSLEAFYRAAFNQGLEAAAKVCIHVSDDWSKVGEYESGNAGYYLAEKIRELKEMK